MRKRSTEATRRMRETNAVGGTRGAVSGGAGFAKSLTIGLDLGDRMSQICMLDSMGEIVEETRVATTKSGLTRVFDVERLGKCRVAMEVGTHSPWVSRLLREMGHEVLVANSRKLRFIYQNRGKTDRVDAESLARVARMDPALLSPVKHRDEEVAQDLAVLRARDLLVRTRVKLIGHARGAVKSAGHRLKASSTRAFTAETESMLPKELRETLGAVYTAIDALSGQIRALNQRVREMATKKYPETGLLRQVAGVGYILSLAYVLTLETPDRFEKSRMVGPYLGMVPARRQSGDSDPQLRITKEGDGFMRCLLVQGAQYILGPFGPDCDLRRFGLALEGRGGKYARKRAVIAVARKLAVLLHKLWRSGEVYEADRRLALVSEPAQA